MPEQKRGLPAEVYYQEDRGLAEKMEAEGFTEQEKEIIRMILVIKGITGINTRSSALIAKSLTGRVEEEIISKLITPNNMIEHMGATAYRQIESISSSFGIARERYSELESWAFENETKM